MSWHLSVLAPFCDQDTSPHSHGMSRLTLRSPVGLFAISGQARANFSGQEARACVAADTGYLWQDWSAQFTLRSHATALRCRSLISVCKLPVTWPSRRVNPCHQPPFLGFLASCRTDFDHLPSLDISPLCDSKIPCGNATMVWILQELALC